MISNRPTRPCSRSGCNSHSPGPGRADARRGLPGAVEAASVPLQTDRKALCSGSRSYAPDAGRRCLRRSRSEERFEAEVNKRRIELGASLVCSVVNTRCPVSDACTAICAVSRSRVSPTRMMSGSDAGSYAGRRRSKADFRTDLDLDEAVDVVFDGVFDGEDFFSRGVQFVERGVKGRCFTRAGGAGDDDDAVGLVDQLAEGFQSSPRMPMRSRSQLDVAAVEIRITTDSPNMVGNTATRRSTGLLLTISRYGRPAGAGVRRCRGWT